MKLRARLFQLIAGTVVPLVFLAIVLGTWLVQREQQTFRDGASARIHAFMAAVDAELRGNFRVAESLAASRSLADGNLEVFYQVAGRVLRSQPDWQNIILATPDGEQILNLARTFGAELDPSPDMDSLQEVVDSREPVAGNVFFGKPIQQYAVPIRVPVFDSDQGLRYVLTAVIGLDAFAHLFRELDLPPAWVSGLIDGTGHFIGRVPSLPPEAVASDDFRNAISQSHEGWYRGLTVEQVDTYTAFKVSDISQWSVGIAIPARTVNAGVRNAAWIIVLGSLISIAIALLFAIALGRSITRPISQLAASTRALGRGKAPSGRKNPESIQEVRELSKALDDASEAITERHALLEREQIALREADRAKDEFLAMLGHELRNPLGAITTAVQVLKLAEPGKDPALRSQATIERQAHHMTRLIEDLLDVSGVTMGKVTLKRQPFDLAQFARNVSRTWNRSNPSRTGAVEIEAQEVWVNADRSRMEQVLSNLLENACKFSPAESPVRITVSRHHGDAVLEVSDQGEGIAQEQLDQVFELFVQGKSDPARTRGGMGVGLALVKRIVEMHGGTVEARSAGVGRGATFLVRMPAIPRPSVKTAEKGSPPVSEPRPLRILLTEDNDDAREMMQSLLVLDGGHEVRLARNGVETLAAIEEELPDLVLMDIGLPDMDGYEVARRIGQISGRQRMKLIALTGFGQAGDARRAYEAGFDLHLTKPVALNVLRDALATLRRDERIS